LILQIQVIGLGNILFGDEGFGVEAAMALKERSGIPPEVNIIDGGTLGVALLEYVESADSLLVFDAIIPQEYEFKVHVYRDAELPSFIHRKMSAHQMGFSELLSLAKLHDRMPDRVALVGVPPKNVILGESMSEAVGALVQPAVDAGMLILEEWHREDVKE